MSGQDFADVLEYLVRLICGKHNYNSADKNSTNKSNTAIDLRRGTANNIFYKADFIAFYCRLG